MSPADPAATALAEIASIPRDGDEPVFPAPWAATGFAMTVALHERGQFTWAEWAGRLGGAIAATGEDAGADTGNDPEAYWRCWLTALEETIAAAGIAGPDVLEGLRAAWREAAAATPHGEPITLSRKVSDDIGKSKQG